MKKRVDLSTRAAIAMVVLLLALPSAVHGGLVNRNKKWPLEKTGRKVGFIISMNRNQEEVREAVRQWNRQIGQIICLSEVTDRPGKATAFIEFKLQDDPVRRNYSEGTAGWIGQVVHDVRIGQNLGQGLATILHEVGHVFSLDHEHQRCDRDRFVKYEDEIVPSDSIWKKLTNLYKDEYTTLGCPGFIFNDPEEPIGSYDFASIMHYPLDASESQWPRVGFFPLALRKGSAEAEEAFRRSGLSELSAVGREPRLSAGDLEALRSLYSSGPPHLATCP